MTCFMSIYTGAVGGRPDLLPDQNIPAVSLEHLQDGERRSAPTMDTRGVTSHTERHVVHSTDGRILTETRYKDSVYDSVHLKVLLYGNWLLSNVQIDGS